MEAFEITFFCLRDNHNKGAASIITKQFGEHDVFQKKNIVEFFCNDGKDYVEFCLSIFDLIITENDFDYIMTKISQFVSTIFEKSEDILLATGIYELTGYYTENKRYFAEFDTNFIQKFPIVFLRKSQSFNSGKIIYDDANVTCVFYENAQSIIS